MSSEWESPNYSTLFKCIILIGLLITPIAILLGLVPLIGAVFLAAPWYVIMLYARRSNEHQRVVASSSIILVQIFYLFICWRWTLTDARGPNIGFGLLTLCLPVFYIFAMSFLSFVTFLIGCYVNNRTGHSRDSSISSDTSGSSRRSRDP